MDWQTSGEQALGTLSETKMAKTRIHDGDDIMVSLTLSATDMNAEQNPRRVFVNGHTQVYKPENKGNHGLTTF